MEARSITENGLSTLSITSDNANARQLIICAEPPWVVDAMYEADSRSTPPDGC